MPKPLKTQAVARVAPEEDVRARVLEAAAVLIHEGGLASLSMREVARRAGVSHQAPYHYFPDRESILAAVAEQGFILLQGALDAVSGPETKTSAADRLARLGEVYVRFAYQHPAHFRVMFRPDFVDMARFPKALECGHRAFDRLLSGVHECIEEGLNIQASEQALVVFGWSVVHGLACLLLDGCLSIKMPDQVAALAQSGLKPGETNLVGDVMQVFRSMVLAGSVPRAPAVIPREESAKRKSTRVASARATRASPARRKA